MPKNKKILIESYEDYLKLKESSVAYDEQDAAPDASYRSEDYKAKDDLRHSGAIIEELLRVILDGEQLDPEQLDIITNIFNDLQRLKRSIEGREEIKAKQEKKRKDKQTFGQ